MIAQNAQPMHLFGSTTLIKLYPFLLILTLSSANIFVGQTFTHKLQPLHFSTSKYTFPFGKIIPPTTNFFLSIILMV